MGLQLNTVIFDMDGLLIDSDPLWSEAGGEVLAMYGKTLKPAQYETTKGLRTREWLEYWFGYFRIDGSFLLQAEEDIIQLVMAKIRERGKAMPGTNYILDYFSKRGFTIALATSSPFKLAEQVVEQLNIGSYFSLLQSAELLPYGKPHPEVYMQCAAALGANPLQCLCFEDSFNGMIAAKAAKMKCVMVPEHSLIHHAHWDAADLKISSLQNFNDLLLQNL